MVTTNTTARCERLQRTHASFLDEDGYINAVNNPCPHSPTTKKYVNENEKVEYFKVCKHCDKYPCILNMYYAYILHWGESMKDEGEHNNVKVRHYIFDRLQKELQCLSKKTQAF